MATVTEINVIEWDIGGKIMEENENWDTRVCIALTAWRQRPKEGSICGRLRDAWGGCGFGGANHLKSAATVSPLEPVTNASHTDLLPIHLNEKQIIPLLTVLLTCYCETQKSRRSDFIYRDSARAHAWKSPIPSGFMEMHEEDGKVLGCCFVTQTPASISVPVSNTPAWGRWYTCEGAHCAFF